MKKTTTKSSTKKTVKPTVKAEPKKIAKSTAKVNSVSKQDSTKTVIDEIKIGDQIWTTKNLDVETYRNGEAIPQVEDLEAWGKLTTGAWCYYENKTSNGPKYGKLYNWYAVNDPRGLAPKGFHIPSDQEWTILTDNLGDEAGTKMKSTSGWDDDGYDGTNSSGFEGLPGGWRKNDGGGSYGYLWIGGYGYWWSSSEFNTTSAWIRQMAATNGDGGPDENVYRLNLDKHSGFSVRCLKD